MNISGATGSGTGVSKQFVVHAEDKTIECTTLKHAVQIFQANVAQYRISHGTGTGKQWCYKINGAVVAMNALGNAEMPGEDMNTEGKFLYSLLMTPPTVQNTATPVQAAFESP